MGGRAGPAAFWGVTLDRPLYHLSVRVSEGEGKTSSRSCRNIDSRPFPHELPISPGGVRRDRGVGTAGLCHKVACSSREI